MGTAAVNGGVSSETRTTKNNALCDIQLGPDSTNNAFKGAGVLTAYTISSRTHKSLAVIFPLSSCSPVHVQYTNLQQQPKQ